MVNGSLLLLVLYLCGPATKPLSGLDCSNFDTHEVFKTLLFLYFKRHLTSKPTDSTRYKLLSRLADFLFLLAPVIGHRTLHINVQFAVLCQNRVRNGCLCCGDDNFTEITTMTENTYVLINVLTTLAVALVSNWAMFKYNESAGVGMLFCIL